LDEDWEKDFDVEVTEHELLAAKQRLASSTSVAVATVAMATAAQDDAGKVCSTNVLLIASSDFQFQVEMPA